MSGHDTVERGTAESAGYDVMLATADVLAAGKHDRDIRYQRTAPFRCAPSFVAPGMANPRWSLETLLAGKPNVAHDVELLQCATSYAEVQKTLISPGFAWESLQKLRERWKDGLLV